MITKITNASIVDGTGARLFRGSLLLEGDTIAQVGSVGEAEADEVIDATGLIACPGFIDIHRHCDLSVLDGNFGRIERNQGLTTVIGGCCGIAPVPTKPETSGDLLDTFAPMLGPGTAYASHADYRRAVAGSGLPLNFGFFAGAGAIILAAKGRGSAPFTRAQMADARDLLAQALSAGALGLSLGLMYPPDTHCSVDELAELASVLRPLHKPLVVQLRSEADALCASIEEAVYIARRAGVPLHISHFKSSGARNWQEGLFRGIEVIERERADGLAITVDFHPYDCETVPLARLIPPSMLSDGLECLTRRLSSADGVRELTDKTASGEPGWENPALAIGWDKIVLSSVRQSENERFINRPFSDAARLYGFDSEPALLAHLIRAEKGNVAVRLCSMLMQDVYEVARLPYAIAASEALYGASAPSGSNHPRLYGAFPRFICEFVFERQILSLESAVHKITSLPAQCARLTRLGQIKAGYTADLVLFSREMLRDRANYQAPTLPTQGVVHVFVNGRRDERGAGRIVSGE